MNQVQILINIKRKKRYPKKAKKFNESNLDKYKYRKKKKNIKKKKNLKNQVQIQVQIHSQI